MAFPFLPLIANCILPVVSSVVGTFFKNKIDIAQTKQLNSLANKQSLIQIGLSFVGDMVSLTSTCVKHFVTSKVEQKCKQSAYKNQESSAITPEVIFHDAHHTDHTKNNTIRYQNAIDEKLKIISAIAYNGESISETALYLLEFYSGISNYEILFEKIRSLAKTKINCSELHQYVTSEREKYDFTYMLFVIAAENTKISQQQIEILHTIAYTLGYSSDDIKRIIVRMANIIQEKQLFNEITGLAKNLISIFNNLDTVQQSIQNLIHDKSVEYTATVKKIREKYNLVDELNNNSAMELETKIKSLQKQDVTQLALDASKALSRIDSMSTENNISNLPHIQRLNQFFGIDNQNGNSLANVNKLQSNSLQLLKIIEEQNLITANILSSVQNNLSILVDMNVETINIVDKLVDSITSRVDALEEEVKQIKASVDIMNWLATIDMLGYEKYSPIVRFFKVIKDFYLHKQSDWNFRELVCLYKALKLTLEDTPLSWDQQIALNDLMNLFTLNTKDQEILSDLFAKDDHSYFFDEDVMQDISILSYNALGMFFNSFNFYAKTLPLVQNYLSCDAETVTQAMAKSIVEKNLALPLDTTLSVKNLALDLLTAISIYFNKTQNHIQDQKKEEQHEIKNDLAEALVCYNEENYTKSFELFKALAENGDATAQYYLAQQYGEGQGVSEDDDEAVKWFRKAAEQGFAPAQKSLGNCYYYGNGVTQYYVQAVQWYRKAAEQDFAPAQKSLGNCYYYGRGVAQDYAQAVQWFRKAAEQGDALAQYKLGYCYDIGNGIAQDYTQAKYWYRKATEQGYDNAKEALKLLP